MIDRYLNDTIQQFLGKEANATFPPELSSLLLREEEYQEIPKDQWENWEHSFANNFRRGKLFVPEIDLWLSQFSPSPRWPNGHRFAVCLTHDVDHISDQKTFPQRFREVKKAYALGNVKQMARTLGKLLLRRSTLHPDTKHTLQTSVEIEQKHGVSASYFFTVYPVSPISCYDCIYTFDDPCLFREKKTTVGKVIQLLESEGFDIGLHGSYHSATHPKLLKTQKMQLDALLKSPSISTRQHWLHWKFPDTLKLQEDAGIKVDSTLGYNRSVGFRCGTSLPFHLFDLSTKTRSNILEVPMILQDGALIGNNAHELSPKDAFILCKQLIDQIAATNGCATLLFHPDIFLKEGMAELYSDLIAYCKKSDGWFANMRQIHEWWTKKL